MNPFLSVRFRLFALCAGLLIVLGGTIFFLRHIIAQRQASMLEQQEQHQRFDTIHSAQLAVSRYRLWFGQANAAILSGDTAREDPSQQEADAARQELDTRLERLAAFDPASAGTIREALEDLSTGLQDTVAAVMQGDGAQVQASQGEIRKHLAATENTLKAAEQREQALVEGMMRQEREASADSMHLSGYIVAAATLFSLLLTLAIVRSIIKPLQTTVAAIRKVNAGETDVTLPPVSADEFGDMAVALRQFRDQAERLRRIAYRDALTGLANRARLEEALRHGIEACKVNGRGGLALLFIDLDNFKSVNESYGHSVGDRYLCEAARRLQQLVPPSALICRYSGDKFTVLVEKLRRDDTMQPLLRSFADRILRGMVEPYKVGEDLLHMSVSIGIALYPEDGQTGEQIASSADAAMYLAKRSGRNNAQLATPELTEDVRKQLALVGDMRRGLDKGEFEPYYQPILDAESGRVVGAEALLRWHHPVRGLVLPGEFIRVAEETGLIAALGERCLTLAYKQVLRWHSQGRELRVSVNLSARQIQDRKVVTLLQGLHASGHAAGQYLEFEITESAMLERIEQSQQTLAEIKGLGHRLSIDDFGTGYSSMGYLQRFPIDKIKIDRTFVAKMESSRQAQAIISATLALAKNLDLEVVAEGVETAAQMRQLREAGCRLQQGFFFSPALPADELETWIAVRERHAGELHAFAKK